jgi:hypothetical protein
MRHYVLTLFLFLLCSCKEKKMRNIYVNEVEFVYAFHKSTPLKYVGGVNYQRFSFYRNEDLNFNYKTIKKTTSLDVIIPDNLKVFSLNDNSECKCIYTYKSSSNNFISDTIRSGIVKGVLIDKNLWDVVIKVKDFNFKGIISSDIKNNSFYIKQVFGKND